MDGLRKILEELEANKRPLEEVESLINNYFQSMSYIENVENMTRFDSCRKDRTGIPEAVFAKNKSVEQIKKIISHVLPSKNYLLITRLSDEKAQVVLDSVQSYPDFDIHYNKDSEILLLKKKGFEFEKHGGKIAIFTAGTSDIPIAQEAQIIAEIAGCEVMTYYDIGIAGIHRIFEPIKDILAAEVDCVIVVAGMEGTLPGLIASLIDIPVIGVPTSVGYGFNGQGISALTSILQSCAPGLTAVNIDNGFGAGATAALISKRVSRERQKKK